jgi:hypothetical protein
VTKMLDRCRYAVTVSTIFVSTLLRRPPPRGLPHLPRPAHTCRANNIWGRLGAGCRLASDVLESGEPAAGAASAETAASGEAVYSTVLDDDRDIRRAAAADTTGAVPSMRIAVLEAGRISGYDGALLSRGDDPPTDEGASQLTSSPSKTAMITGASPWLLGSRATASPSS